MILIDANLLLYAYDSASPEHAQARRWLEEVFAKPDPVLLPWHSVYAVIRIANNPRAWRSPLTIEEARAIVDEWLSLPNVVVPSPGERHWDILRELLVESQCQGPLVADTVLAALAIEHGAELCTNDRDFSRFPKLRTVNPLHEPEHRVHPHWSARARLLIERPSFSPSKVAHTGNGARYIPLARKAN